MESLKVKLKSATITKLHKLKKEHTLRNTERILSEDLQVTKAETEVMVLQMEDLKHQISNMKTQVTMIGICEVSEKAKIEHHKDNLTHHNDGFKQLFALENAAIQFNKTAAKEREEEEQQLEKQKQNKLEEKKEQLAKEAASIEEECDIIEKECAVLKKRNKAIMLKLRRKLIESEDLRRELMKTLDGQSPNT